MKPYLSYFKFNSHLRYKLDQEIIDMHKICIHYLKKHYKEAHLITNQEGKKMLGHLDFTSISCDFDEYEEIFNQYKDVWSLGKLFSYKKISEKGEPFIHVDNDVFLLKKLPIELTNSGLFAQSQEADVWSWYGLENFFKYCKNKYIAEKFKFNNYYNSINMGIFGGNDLDFINQYASSAINLVLDPENKGFWLDFNAYDTNWNKAAIAEQYYLYLWLQFKNKKITFLSDLKTEDLFKTDYSHLMERKFSDKFKEKISYISSKIK